MTPDKPPRGRPAKFGVKMIRLWTYLPPDVIAAVTQSAPGRFHDNLRAVIERGLKKGRKK